MISKTRRRCTAVVAALLCATTAAAQENRGTPEQRAAGSALATFPTLPGSNSA